MKTESQIEPAPGVVHVSKLAIIATIEIPFGRRDEFLTSLMAHKARCLKDEAGTLEFEVLAPHQDDTKVLSYELYQSDAAFDVHRNGPSIAQFRKETAEMGIKITVTRCALVE
jgi:quinol monooxygenase YgiN